MLRAVTYFDEILDAFALQGVQQSRGHDDRLAFGEGGLHLRDDVLVIGRRFGQQDCLGILWKGRRKVDGNADHAQEVMQKILADGVVRAVTRDADGCA